MCIIYINVLVVSVNDITLGDGKKTEVRSKKNETSATEETKKDREREREREREPV